MTDAIIPRGTDEDILEFGARVAKALHLEEVEVRPSAEGGFAIALGRELTLDEFVALSNSGINYKVILEFQ